LYGCRRFIQVCVDAVSIFDHKSNLFGKMVGINFFLLFIPFKFLKKSIYHENLIVQNLNMTISFQRLLEFDLVILKY
jgi:hypothetical protein